MSIASLASTLSTLWQAVEKAPKQGEPLSTEGMIFLILSCGSVAILTFWCYRKVLGLPTEEKDTVKDLHSA